MSTYTTTLNEVMKDINKRTPKPIQEMIEISRPIIFDFDYDTPSTVDKKVFKKWFETTFLTKFALWEIGFDTYEHFHLQLWSKCNRIMPMYSIILDRIYTAQRVGDEAFYNIKKGTETIKANKQINTDIETGTKTKSTDVHSTLPVNMISTNDIGTVKYADDGNKRSVDTNSDTSNSTKDNLDEKITYDIKMGCYIDSMKKFFEALNQDVLNATDKLFDEFNYLFLGVM